MKSFAQTVSYSRLLFGLSKPKEILTDLCELWQMFKVSIVTGPIVRAEGLYGVAESLVETLASSQGVRGIFEL